MALGSLLEFETELLIAFNLDYIDLARFDEIQNVIIELQRMITGFKNQLDKD
jgi:four helix bundle protein